jgi:hypothetical protein
MYCNVITSSTIQKPNDRPFEINDLVRVLEEKRFSFIFDWKEDWWYKVSPLMLNNLGEVFWIWRKLQLVCTFWVSTVVTIRFVNRGI